MKSVIIRVLILLLGITMIGSVILIETDGSLGFLLATFGLFFIFVGLTFKGIIKVIAEIF